MKEQFKEVQGKDLEIGKLYRDIAELSDFSTLFEFLGYDDNGDLRMKYITGDTGYNGLSDNHILSFSKIHSWYYFFEDNHIEWEIGELIDTHDHEAHYEAKGKDRFGREFTCTAIDCIGEWEYEDIERI